MHRNRPATWIASVTLLLCSSLAWAEPSMEQLKRLSPCELDRLYAAAEPGPLPIGVARGRVLYLADARLPRAKARLASTLWKGKYFDEAGGFTNQWPGFRAISSQADSGSSWFDGQPAHILEYPPGTPVFGNVRDEIRQICPGLYLGRIYERDGCRRFQGYFALQTEACTCPHR